MVKLTKYILLACIVLIQQACVKDLQYHTGYTI